MFTFSITAFNMRNLKQAEINSTQKRQRDHTIILIAHFYPNRSFPELTLLHHASVAFLTFTISERRKKIEDINKILYKNRFERARSSCYPLQSIRVSKSFKGISVCIL